MSLFRGEVWLRFVKDYFDVNGKLKYARGFCAPVDPIEAECLLDTGYAVPYEREESKGRGFQNAMGATG